MDSDGLCGGSGAGVEVDDCASSGLGLFDGGSGGLEFSSLALHFQSVILRPYGRVALPLQIRIISIDVSKFRRSSQREDFGSRRLGLRLASPMKVIT